MKKRKGRPAEDLKFMCTGPPPMKIGELAYWLEGESLRENEQLVVTLRKRYSETIGTVQKRRHG
ncbi:MAG: hypothetical protein AAF802_22995 [Planctomycetota bacterium]